MMRQAWIVALFVLISSCSTIHMKYKAKYMTDNGKSGEYILRKSYPVGGTKTWCIITGIFYGGACWIYLGMPNSDHRKKIRKDAQANLQQYFGSNRVQLTNEAFRRISWDDRAEDQKVIASNGQTLLAPKKPEMNNAPASRPQSAAGNDEDEDGFLR